MLGWLRPALSNRSRQRGIALVTVLISVAIITGLVSNLAYQQFIQSRRAGVVLHREQAIMYLFAVEAYAKILLNLDSIQSGTDSHTQLEPWGRGINNPFEGGNIKAAIIELDGRFNLNNLRRLPTEEEINSGKQDVNLRSIWHECFKQLLGNYTEELKADTEALTEAVEDWLDEDVQQRAKGAEDIYYQSPSDLYGSYKPANHLIGDVQELALIKGFEELFAETKAPTLLRQLAALPSTTTTINVNTATAEVLGCLEPEGRLTRNVANRIIAARENTPFESLSGMIDLLNKEFPVKKMVTKEDGSTAEEVVTWDKLLPMRYLDVRSYFALLRAELSFGFSNLVAYSLLQRTPDGAVRILRRSMEPS